MYQSLANLIRWSDQVMLEGVNSEDKEMVTTVKGVIKAVLDGVKVHEKNIVNYMKYIIMDFRRDLVERGWNLYSASY